MMSDDNDVMDVVKLVKTESLSVYSGTQVFNMGASDSSFQSSQSNTQVFKMGSSMGGLGA